MKVAICGSNYGRFYLPAIHQTGNLEIRAILGRGSQRSNDLATEAHVQLVTDVTDLPDDVEVACVATTAFKQGPLILSLLDRGIHVLAEHPVSADLIKAARSGRYRAELHVNSLFSDTPMAHRYYKIADEKQRTNSLLFAAGYCSGRTVFSWLDLVTRAIGCSEISDINVRELEKLQVIDFRLGEITIAAAVQTHAEGAIFTHCLNLGFGRGTLSFTGSFGPLTWTPALELVKGKDALYDVIAGATPPDGTDMMAIREAANVYALQRLIAKVKEDKDSPEQSTNHLVAICQASEMIDPRIRNNEVKHA